MEIDDQQEDESSQTESLKIVVVGQQRAKRAVTATETTLAQVAPQCATAFQKVCSIRSALRNRGPKKSSIQSDCCETSLEIKRAAAEIEPSPINKIATAVQSSDLDSHALGHGIRESGEIVQSEIFPEESQASLPHRRFSLQEGHEETNLSSRPGPTEGPSGLLARPISPTASHSSDETTNVAGIFLK